MRAISLWQPWASLWVGGPKIHETRDWATSYRGWLLVHAAAKPMLAEIGGDVAALILTHGLVNLSYGAIIGAVKIEDCTLIERHNHASFFGDDFVCGNFAYGRFAWRRSEAVVFKKPIPYRGRQRFFEVPWQLLPAECPISDEDRARAFK